jgi:hypothetical protein
VTNKRNRVWQLIPHEAITHWQKPARCVMTGATEQLHPVSCTFTVPGSTGSERRLPVQISQRVGRRDLAVVLFAVVALGAVAAIARPAVPVLIGAMAIVSAAAVVLHGRARPRLKGRPEGVWIRVPQIAADVIDDAVVSALRAHHGLQRDVGTTESSADSSPFANADEHDPAPNAAPARSAKGVAQRPKLRIGTKRSAGIEHRATMHFGPTRDAVEHVDAGRYADAAAACTALSPDEHLAVLWQADPTRATNWPLDNDPKGVGHLAGGVGLIKLGWSIRGTGPTETVPRADMERFWSHLRTAETLFLESERRNPSSPLPSAAMITSGRGLEIPTRELQVRSQQSMSLSPTFSAASALVVGLGPVWGGKPDDAMAFVSSIFEATEPGHPARGAAAFAARECLHAGQMTTRTRTMFSQLVKDLVGGPAPTNAVELEILAEATYVAARLGDNRTSALAAHLDSRWCAVWQHVPDPIALISQHVATTENGKAKPYEANSPRRRSPERVA